MRKASIVFVSLLIGFVFFGVLAGVVQRLREAGALVNCRRNLQQFAIAVHSYHDQYDRFPQAAIANDRLDPDQRLSWQFELDPYIHARMDRTWNKGINKPWFADDNIRYAQYGVVVTDCPVNVLRQRDGLWLTNYVGITGIGEDAEDLAKGHPRAGFFGFDRKIGKQDLKDGAAVTLMIAETNSENGPWIAGGHATVRALLPGRPYLGETGQFGSLHRGGSNVAFADGSVRLLPASIDPKILESLATIAGSERVEAIPVD